MKTANALIPHTSIRRVEADGVTVFYREAGPPNGPVILLLHGFPTSSFQYRELIPRLADRYRVIAPDLPGFGFTEVPEQRRYKYSFDALASTMLAFTDALQLKTLRALCVRLRCAGRLSPGNGAPGARSRQLFRKTAMRMKKDLAMPGVRSENTGLTPTAENREVIRKNILTLEGTRWQYTHGVKESRERCAGVVHIGYGLYWNVRETKRFSSICFWITRSNVKLYPKFQEYFRKSKPPLLAIWGKNDPFFIPPGAEAFRKDLPNAKVQFLDTGHFAIETHVVEIAAAIKEFFDANSIAS